MCQYDNACPNKLGFQCVGDCHIGSSSAPIISLIYLNFLLPTLFMDILLSTAFLLTLCQEKLPSAFDDFLAVFILIFWDGYSVKLGHNELDC
jgi:hypothetical protein